MVAEGTGDGAGGVGEGAERCAEGAGSYAKCDDGGCTEGTVATPPSGEEVCA